MGLVLIISAESKDRLLDVMLTISSELVWWRRHSFESFSETEVASY
jgi:hypothetical protein